VPAEVQPAATEDGISVFFSPQGGCTAAIVREIGLAQTTLKVQAYYFTSANIAKAVVDAARRGVEVTVLLDKSQQSQRYSSATFLRNAGIQVFIDSQHPIAHNKIILIDGRTIITGSFNYTKAAEEANAENLLIIHDKLDLYTAYDQNFTHHLEHSAEYTGPLGAPVGDERTTPRRTEAPDGATGGQER
jgi:phosphatidylserine/phosphatidylglycerophosphate/cardiolipin synthase-like enzyme